MKVLVLALLFVAGVRAEEPRSSAALSARVRGVVACGPARCLDVSLRTPNGVVRLSLGGDAAGTLQARFGGHATGVVKALLPTLGRAMGKRKLRLVAEQVIGSLAGIPGLRFYEKEPGVVLDGRSEQKVARIAERFFRATGTTILVTSGTRTPLEQADAMLTKIRAGGSLGIYRDRNAIKEIRAAAKAARKAGKDRSGMVAAVAAVIEAQMRRGVHISQHLLAGAADIRSTGLGASQRRAFRKAALAEPGVTILTERRPPHFHLSLH